MDLRSKLSQRCNKDEALAMAAHIGNDPDRFAELIACVLSDDEAVSKYGSWVIGHVMEKHPALIRPHIGPLLSNLEKPGLHGSILRSTMKALAEAGDIPEALQGRALQHSFDLLMAPKTAVAIQVLAMQTVFNISKNEPDLLRELREIIDAGMPHGTAAFKARGGKYWGRLGRFWRNSPNFPFSEQNTLP